jgi:eukaryotic-like serine/threonine-protein kinase
MDQNLETLKAALLDRYEVEKPIGRGGMATVYLARDLRHDRRVAIKVMSPELAATIGADRFGREVKIAAKLSHPNVLGVFDSGEAQGLLFYVMPFVEGETLRDKLTRERQLSIDESIQIICEVADALGYAHSNGIVHRDIKPENILLQNGRAMVADFGIARLAEQSSEKLTKTGMAVGTAQYMSPEQAAGEPTDARSDIYALGCTLFEMLVGQPPFMGANAMAIMAQHSMATVPEIRVMRQSIPEELEGVIRRSMEKTPADRFQTMEELKRAVLGEIPATSVHSRYTARYRAQGKPGGGGGGGGGIATNRLTWIIGGAVVVAVAATAVFLMKRPRIGAVPDANKVAVLYFTDETGGAMAHVADGLTESLIERLEDVPALEVVPVNGVRALRGKSRGAVTREGSKAKVTISVVDAASDAPYGRRSISVDTAQIVSLQGMVADEVAGFLREAIGGEVRLKTGRGETRSTAAWTLAERAARLRKDADSLSGVRANEAALAALAQADSLLAQAQSQDGEWTRVPAMRAGNDVLRAQLMPRKTPAQLAMIDSGLAMANAALAIQSNDAAALEAKGRLLYAEYTTGFESDPLRNAALLDSAEATLVRAVQSNRTQAGAWAALSSLYYSKQRIPEANSAAKNAYEADAFLASANGILRRLFWTSHDLEMYPEALDWCSKGRRRFPADPFFVECRLWMYTTRYEPPNIDSAWAYQARYVDLYDAKQREYADKYSRALVAGALARKGDADSARHVLSAARATPAIDPNREIVANEAVVRVILGDYDVAVGLLENYLTVHPDHRKGFATRVSPWWRDLQGNARFKRLLATAH